MLESFGSLIVIYSSHVKPLRGPHQLSRQMANGKCSHGQVVVTLIYRPTCNRPDNAAAVSTMSAFYFKGLPSRRGVEHNCRKSACPNMSCQETHCTKCARLLNRMI